MTDGKTGENDRFNSVYSCPGCGWPVPIRPAANSERIDRWTCGWCGRIFEGVFDDLAPEDHYCFAITVQRKHGRHPGQKGRP